MNEKSAELELEPLKNRFYSENQQHFDETRKLINFIEIVLADFSQRQIKQDEITRFGQFILYAAFRSDSHGRAIWRLCNLGYELEASILLRTIVEMTIFVRFAIHDDGKHCEKLAEQYFSADLFREIEMCSIAIEICSRNGSVKWKNIFKDRLAFAESEVKRLHLVRTDSDSKTGEPSSKIWPKWKLSKIASSARFDKDLKGFYETNFKYLSTLTHFSPSGIWEFLSKDESGWTLRPEPRRIDQILLTYYDCHVRILSILCDHLDRPHPYEAFNYFFSTRNKLMSEWLSEGAFD